MRKPCCGRETAKFNTYRNLQRHRAVLPAIARLLFSGRNRLVFVFLRVTGNTKLSFCFVFCYFLSLTEITLQRRRLDPMW